MAGEWNSMGVRTKHGNEGVDATQAGRAYDAGSCGLREGGETILREERRGRGRSHVLMIVTDI